MFGERERLARLSRNEAERRAEVALQKMKQLQAVEDDYARLLEHARTRSLEAVEDYALCLAQLEVAVPVELVTALPVTQPRRMPYERRSRVAGR